MREISICNLRWFYYILHILKTIPFGHYYKQKFLKLLEKSPKSGSPESIWNQCLWKRQPKQLQIWQ